jgi:hypothetical protein
MCRCNGKGYWTEDGGPMIGLYKVICHDHTPKLNPKPDESSKDLQEQNDDNDMVGNDIY